MMYTTVFSAECPKILLWNDVGESFLIQLRIHMKKFVDSYCRMETPSELPVLHKTVWYQSYQQHL